MKHFTGCLFALLASAVLLGLASAPAYGVDGVVLINQNTVTSGLPGCPTGGTFPVIICQSGSYRLSGNLTTTGTGDVIDINADNVTLDLNGFSISGPVTCDGDIGDTTTACSGTAGNGVFVGSLTANVTVRNGTIRGMNNGIRSVSAGILIEEMHTSKNIFGISVNGNAVVRRNTVTNNQHGIISQASVIVNNIVSVNATFGIQGSRDTVVQNVATRNGTDGIFEESGLISENAASQNGGTNINAPGSVSTNNGCGTSTPC